MFSSSPYGFVFRRRPLLLLVGAFAAVMLGGAFVFQYGFGLHPCELCLYQRYPYAAVIALAVLGVRTDSDRLMEILILSCAALLFIDGSIAFYHAGVEWGILPGPATCSSTGAAGQSLDDMRNAIKNAPYVPCNQPMASFLGLSMAAWNGLLAFAASIFTFTMFDNIKRAEAS